jgi:hypothetical protein
MWREKLYEDGAYVFKKVEPNKDFYQSFKKVFDIVVDSEKEIKMNVWD